MATSLKVSPEHYIALDHLKEWTIFESEKKISLTIDYERGDINFSAECDGEGEYHRVKREIEEFFSNKNKGE